MSRRRNRREIKQWGGQQPVVSKKLANWMEALAATDIMSDPTVSAAGITRPELSIGPAPATPTEDAADYRLLVEEPIDYRVLALQMASHDVFLTAQTREVVLENVARQDEDSLVLLTKYENALREKAGATKIGTLSEAEKYPLLLWVLAKNYQGDLDAPSPALVPYTEVERIIAQLASASQSASPTEEAPSEPVQ